MSFEDVVLKIFDPIKTLENSISKPYNPNTIPSPGVSFELYGETFYSTPNRFMEAAMYAASFLPICDKIEYKDPKSMIEEFRNTYPWLLSKTDILNNNDSLNIDDWTLKDFIISGPGILLLEKDGDKFKIDVNHLSKYPVRGGFMRYGGSIILDANLNPILLEYNGKKAEYMTDESKELKFYIVSSMLVDIVIRIHACQYHIIHSRIAQKIALDKRYKFMYPFIYKNLDSTEAARTVLFGTNRYFHRLYAFTENGLDMFISDCLKGIRMPKTFIELYNKFPTLHDLRFFSDGILIWDAFRKSIKFKYLEADMLSVDVLVSYIFDATVMHELVGNTILKWQIDPRKSSNKLVSGGYIQCDIQTYKQAMLIVMGTVMGKVPMLMNVVDSISQYLEFELDMVSKIIEKWNDKYIKEGKKPYYICYPPRLESTFTQ